jgi:hypothetical protein
MRMILEAKFPIEPFNTLIRKGKAGEVVGKILDDLRPETAHFVEIDGCRGCVMIINVDSSSQIPKFAEPFFLQLNAEVRFRIAMNPGEMQASGLDALAKKWG